jgi:hypothetical protein
MKCTQCDNKAHSRGLCQRCYRKARKADGFTPAKRGRKLKDGSNGMNRHLAEARRIRLGAASGALRILMADCESVPCVSLRQILDILTESQE